MPDLKEVKAKVVDILVRPTKTKKHNPNDLYVRTWTSEDSPLSKSLFKILPVYFHLA